MRKTKLSCLSTPVVGQVIRKNLMKEDNMKKLLVVLVSLILASILLISPVALASPEKHTVQHFHVYLNGVYGRGDLVDSVLTKDIFVSCKNWGDEYALSIPSGTNTFGARWLEVNIYRGSVASAGYLSLSQPVTILKMVDGKWTKIASFAQVIDGYPITFRATQSR